MPICPGLTPSSSWAASDTTWLVEGADSWPPFLNSEGASGSFWDLSNNGAERDDLKTQTLHQFWSSEVCNQEVTRNTLPWEFLGRIHVVSPALDAHGCFWHSLTHRHITPGSLHLHEFSVCLLVCLFVVRTQPYPG